VLRVEARSSNAATARIAIYVRAGAAVRPPELDTNPRSAWSTFGLTHPFGPDPKAANSAVTVRGSYEKDLLVTLVVRGADTLRVTANGRPLTFECDTDPDDLVGGAPCGDVEVVRATEYGAPAQVFDSLYILTSQGLRAGDPVTITVTPSGFSGDDWRLDIFDWTDARGAYATAGTWTRK